MVHIVADLGVFFAFLITSGAWVIARLLGYAVLALGFVVGILLLMRHGVRRARRDKEE